MLLLSEGIIGMIEQKQYDVNYMAMKVIEWQRDGTFKDTLEFETAFENVESSGENLLPYERLERTVAALPKTHELPTALVASISFL